MQGLDLGKYSTLGMMAISAVTIISLIGFLPQNSYAVSGTISGGPSCVAISGTWDNFSTCTVHSLTIHSGETLTIPSGKHLVITGIITINSGGTLDNAGSISVDQSVINNSGTLTNSGFIDLPGGTINNLSGGTFNNLNSIRLFDAFSSHGFINNNSGGNINNSGIISTFSIGNTINNSGGTINNLAGGSIGGAGTIDNSGTITNLGTITNFHAASIITNTGTISNSGTISNGGTLTNTGTITESCKSTFTGNPVVGTAPINTCTSIPEFPFSFSLVIIFVAVAAVYMGIRQKMIPNFKRF
ncbi:MAG TPA: hypothetical protein VEU72_00900 [Nitrosopumilaceae archaeon]|nr:hypothetical protein [Nitrosopumilaceae archaeon]